MGDTTDSPPNAPPLLLYVAYQASALAITATLFLPTLLYRTLLHYIPGRRPHPSWSLRRDLAISAGRLYFSWATRFSLPRPQGHKAWNKVPLVQWLSGGGTETTCVRVPPAPQEWISAIATAGNGAVLPKEVPGFFTHELGRDGQAEGPATAGEKAILYLAGGSWVMGHPMGTPFPYGLCIAARCRVLSVNYRKALSADTAFPAQLLDALAGYAHLLTLGFHPKDVTLVGDSSGAHIHLALARYLAETGAPLPGALMLVSPSVDLSHAPYASIPTDFLSPYLNRRAYPSLARHFPPTARAENPYFSPGITGSWAWLVGEGAPRVWVQHSDSELLTRDQRAWLKRMRAEGVHVEVDVVEGGAHLDAGLAFALGERGPESSWVRLLEAAARIVNRQS